MTIPAEQIGPLMQQLVPMVSTLGLEFVSVSPERVVVTYRDDPAYRNHVGGPHAATMFGLAETATGALTLAAFGDLMDRAVLVPSTARIDFLSVAQGDLTATAEFDADLDAAREIFESGKRPEFDVVAEIATADGKVTGRLRATWTLKLLRTP